VDGSSIGFEEMTLDILTVRPISSSIFNIGADSECWCRTSNCLHTLPVSHLSWEV
jgi:hypothetical protein